MSAQPLVIWPHGIEFVGSVTGTTTAVLPAHATGDVIIAFSFRRGSSTPPDLPTGWTNVSTRAGTSGATAVSARLAYRTATTGSTTSGTWSNATHTVFVIYRHATAPPEQTTWDDGTGASISYNALGGTLSRSWALAFGAHASADGDITYGFESGGWEEREHEVDPGAIAAADTGKATGGGTSYGKTTYGSWTEDSWVTARVELGALHTTSESHTAYTMPSRARAFALTPERARGGSTRALGDLLEVPTELVVRVHVPGTTLANAMSDAYDLISTAELAESVSTYEGACTADGLLGYAIEPAGADALVTLRFAPTSALTPHGFIMAPLGSITIVAPAITVTGGSGVENAVTYDSETVTYDGTAVTYGGA